MRAVRAYTYYLSLPFRYVLSFTPIMPALSSSAHAKVENESTSSRDEVNSENSMSHMSVSTSTHEHATPDENTLHIADVTPVCT